MRTPEQLLVPKIEALAKRVSELEDAVRETEAPDLSGLAESKDLTALAKRVTKAEGDLATVTTAQAAAVPNNKENVSKAALEAVKKENTALKTSLAALERRTQELEGRMSATEEARQTKRPASEPLGSQAKFGRFDDGSQLHGYAEQVLPRGWEILTDQDTGKVFYHNLITDARQWQRPFVVAPPAHGLAPPISAPPAPASTNINITNDNTTNIGLGFSPQTGEMYAAFHRGDIDHTQLALLKEARTMTKGFNKK